MKKPIQVAMLSTEDKSSLAKCIKSGIYSENEGDLVLTGKDTITLKSNKVWEYQYVYITVSQDVEPIKEGDWFYHINLKKIFKCCEASKTTIWANNKEMGDVVYRCRKVIATDDPKLKIFTVIREDGTGLTLPIPQLQQSFLKEFVANPDGKWEVEYLRGSDGHYDKNDIWHWKLLGLKLNQDNEVTITSNELENAAKFYRDKTKEMMYSKEEKMYSKQDLLELTMGNSNIIDWIKENLK